MPVMERRGGDTRTYVSRAPKRTGPSHVQDQSLEMSESGAPTDESADTTSVITFAALGLSADLLASIQAVGYEEPTPIQARTIPAMQQGRDVIAQAQTGSGKTAAFGFPLVDGVDAAKRAVQALVLCPTRELAIQVAEALHKYGKHRGIETLPIYGGQPYERQFRGLQRGPHIVVGTPGRVMDHMRRDTLRLDDLRFFVLDEADEMLDMGFVDDIEWVMQHAPATRQTALFSATMPPRIAELASRYMREPERISVVGKEMTVSLTKQYAYEVPKVRKVDAVTRILDAELPTAAMVFCRTKMGVDELGEALLARGYPVETLHGDLSQSQRDRVMRRFRAGQADLLIATDVAARGIDVTGISHVINFDVPESAEAYVHRIGRTGRAGKEGIAITLVTPRETRWLRQVEKIVRARIEFRRLPTLSDVAARRREQLKEQVLELLENESNYSAYIETVDELAAEHGATPVAAVLLKLFADETGRATNIEQGVDDLQFMAPPPPRPRTDSPDRPPMGGGGPRPDGPSVRLFINVGRFQGIRPQDVVGAIANEAQIPGRVIGAIDIFDNYCFVDVPTDAADRVIEALVRSGIKGRSVNAEISQAAPRPPRRDGGGGGGIGGPRGPRPEGEFRGPQRDDTPAGGDI